MRTKVEVRTIPLHGLFIHRKQVWRSLGKLRAESHSTTAQKVFMNEQDIKEFHEDAEHLRWLYNRMVSEHGESVNFDYMHRFAKIFNKLKQL